MVQVTLERSLSKLHQFESGTRLDSWMFRILQTAWIDERRRRGRQGEVAPAEELDRVAARDGGDFAVRREVAEAMEKLSEDQQALVILVLVEGYSYQEAAEQLGIPIGTVMSRLARARKALMQSLGGEAQLLGGGAA